MEIVADGLKVERAFRVVRRFLGLMEEQVTAKRKMDSGDDDDLLVLVAEYLRQMSKKK